MSKSLLPAMVGIVLLTTWSLAQEAGDADLLTRLNSPDTKTRHLAVNEAQNRPITSADVLIRLRDIAVSDPVEIVRNQAINALPLLESNAPVDARRIDVQKIKPDLIAAAEKGDLPRRRHAIMLLSACLKGDALPTLDKLADEMGVRDIVFTAKLYALPPEQLGAFKLGGLKSQYPEVVDATAASLSVTIGLTTIDADLARPLRAMESDSAGGLWASLILACGGQKIDRPTQQLVDLLGSDRQWIRRSAPYALVQSSAEDAFPAAIAALGHSSLEVRQYTAMALYRRFFPLFEKHIRASDEHTVMQDVYRAKDRPAAMRAIVKKNGIKAAAAYGNLVDASCSERSNPAANKPLADAAVSALQELFQLAKQTEAKSATQPAGK